MNERIQAGDLAQVIRGHACDFGRIFKIARIETEAISEWTCLACKLPWQSFKDAWGVEADDTNGSTGYPLSWLKRIPPLDELERTQIVNEVTA